MRHLHPEVIRGGAGAGVQLLDAQREACEAYIRSQRHEGWTLLPARYDDGGLSGGTMNRPALQRLLADVTAGRVDLVVVYKVDRLTRSLSDFAKIVEVLDAQGASFVSITQQFNTTTSMGRLTLNMLLSFAQFEREVTGERIRDKIAASKRKGMWMGGSVPLGYEVQDRKLVVHGAEADLVQRLYRAYLDRGTVRLVQEWLAREAITGRGGRALGRGALFHLLQNRVYRGEVAHRGRSIPASTRPSSMPGSGRPCSSALPKVGQSGSKAEIPAIRACWLGC
ncbi:recombinase family protein [Siccirubricoccus deserti]